jgi:hypothetical protein
MNICSNLLFLFGVEKQKAIGFKSNGVVPFLPHILLTLQQPGVSYTGDLINVVDQWITKRMHAQNIHRISGSQKECMHIIFIESVDHRKNACTEYASNQGSTKRMYAQKPHRREKADVVYEPVFTICTS